VPDSARAIRLGRCDPITERFQHDVKDLDDGQRRAVFDAILALPAALGDPHTHAGLGLRKLHRSGIWEARVGLGLRLVFGLQTELLARARRQPRRRPPLPQGTVDSHGVAWRLTAAAAPE